MLTIAMLVSASPSAAQPAEQPQQALQAFVKSTGYQSNLTRLFAQIPPDVFQRCRTLVSNGSQVTVVQPVSFASDGYPVSGLWKQSFPVSGCGNDTTLNFFFQGHADEKTASLVGIPGDTHADLTLQRDALRYVDIAVRAVVRDCAEVHIRTTEFVGPVKTSKGGWEELWSTAACGHMLQVPVTFAPDATGTVISAKAPKQKN